MTVNTYRTSPRRLLSGRHRDRQPVAPDRAGQVPKSLNANGKFTVRLKSIVTLPSSSEALVVTARHGVVSIRVAKGARQRPILTGIGSEFVCRRAESEGHHAQENRGLEQVRPYRPTWTIRGPSNGV